MLYSIQKPRIQSTTKMARLTLKRLWFMTLVTPSATTTITLFVSAHL
nr:MAG TPA: hypothetical protein [Caudoviricetes sp.]